MVLHYAQEYLEKLGSRQDRRHAKMLARILRERGDIPFPATDPKAVDPKDIGTLVLREANGRLVRYPAGGAGEREFRLAQMHQVLNNLQGKYEANFLERLPRPTRWGDDNGWVQWRDEKSTGINHVLYEAEMNWRRLGRGRAAHNVPITARFRLSPPGQGRSWNSLHVSYGAAGQIADMSLAWPENIPKLALGLVPGSALETMFADYEEQQARFDAESPNSNLRAVEKRGTLSVDFSRLRLELSVPGQVPPTKHGPFIDVHDEHHYFAYDYDQNMLVRDNSLTREPAKSVLAERQTVSPEEFFAIAEDMLQILPVSNISSL